MKKKKSSQPSSPRPLTEAERIYYYHKHCSCRHDSDYNKLSDQILKLGTKMYKVFEDRRVETDLQWQEEYKAMKLPDDYCGAVVIKWPGGKKEALPLDKFVEVYHG